MRHHVRSLLLVAVFGAAAMAARGANDTTTPVPPADIPEVPPCLNSTLYMCGSVYEDSSMVAECCTTLKKLFKSDQTCICNVVVQTQKMAKEYGLNGTFDGLEIFRQCQMPTTSCEPGKPGYVENAASSGRSIGMSIGAFQILLLLPLFFVLLA